MKNAIIAGVIALVLSQLLLKACKPSRDAAFQQKLENGFKNKDWSGW